MTIGDHRKNDIGLGDQFPIGMRVLVVEADLTCLKNLEELLKKCQYHVTTAQNGITALNLLRENKNNFDLLMTNADMPNMDGFKLLELVGMHLPVILFSSNDDPKMVMRGVLHGACDYLVNPFRMEKLQVIWQHVIRKNMNIKRSNYDTINSDRKIGVDSTMVTNSDQNEKLSEKRKNHREDDVNKNQNPTTLKKKPRVVWSNDLHRKFVDVVNKIGLDNAVPKKILELMKDENLTNKNVASHLQKYRLTLKRIKSEEIQQANMVAAKRRSSNTSYSRRSTQLSEVGDYLHKLNDSKEINRHNNLMMVESNPQEKSLVVSQPSLFSIPSLENKNILSSTMELPATNSNLPLIDYTVPLNVIEPEGNLDYNYWKHVQMNSDEIP
ncbi:two-component response regulator ORR24-like [Vicia villosa]|uniref:two-component response regulator ORR24-like n=1 Tax=Vicia villosa TaxID=3911 RepID=UPI00273BC82B|nr:two-component response regulator ORR24-like [Vicia villosa]